MDYVVIPVLFHSSDSKILDVCDITYKLSDCKVVEVAVFNIDVIMPFVDDNITYSCILTGGLWMCTTLTFDELLDVLDDTEIYSPCKN